MVMVSEPQYLLIVACSHRKRSDPGLLPAIELYDGVNFRVLRRAQREGYWPKNLDVLILSAKYGLLKPNTLIEDYDLRMTLERAMALQPQVGADLDRYLERTSYSEVFVNLGKIYKVALDSSKRLRPLDRRVHYATGGIGEKMSQMKKWLQGVSDSQGGSSNEPR
jgi:cytoplasmic iron level regulating protein YaaA (DUF328/UPF0246 family)